MFVVTGEMVILGADQGVGICKKAVYDRAAGTFYSVGESVFESLGQLNLSGVDALSRKKTTNAPPATPAPPK